MAASDLRLANELTPAQKFTDDYTFEKNEIIFTIGNIEQIRLNLNLSQEQICQLLLVAPSEWTRWLKSKEGAPAYIYQSLNWLVQLRKLN